MSTNKRQTQSNLAIRCSTSPSTLTWWEVGNMFSGGVMEGSERGYGPVLPPDLFMYVDIQ